MDPSMMSAAMDAMKHMPPEQLQKMMANVSPDMLRNFNPDMMQTAMSQMKNMKDDDWKRASEQLKNLTPEQMQQQAAAASNHFSAQQDYTVKASLQLKNEGNTLHSAGKYSEAVEKYEKAKSNVEGMTQKDAVDLRKACTLNLSSCYLNLRKWSQAVGQCNEVLSSEPDSLKGLYRRGQAYMGLGSWQEAVDDLSRSLKLSASDPSQQKLIREKLQEAKDQLSSQRAANARAAPASISASPAEASASAAQPAEEVAAPTSASAPQPSAPLEPAATGAAEPSASSSAAAAPAAAAAAAPQAAASSNSSSQGAGSGPNISPEMLERTAAMLRSNPDYAKQAADMMSNMSDAELERVSKQMGMPLTRDMLAAGKEQIAAMDPAQLEAMAKMQKAVPPELRAKLSAKPNDPEALAASAKMLQQNPDMARMAADMMAKMSPEQLADVSRQMGMPTGTFTPEMAKMAAESFSKMSPEEVQRMAETAAALRAPGGFGSAAGSSSGSAASSAPSTSAAAPAAEAPAAALAAAAAGGAAPVMTPEMAKMAADMMGSMSPEQLQAMTSAAAAMSGGAAGAGGAAMPTITPEMAKMAADMMSKMGPEEVARMQKMASDMGMRPGGAGGASMSQQDMMSQMSKMDPKMMESALSMMKGMDEESLAAMMMSSGMVKNEAQAKAMAKQMQGISDTQMKMLTKAMGVVQGGVRTVQRTKEFVRSRGMLMLALVVLVLALLLRYLGVM